MKLRFEFVKKERRFSSAGFEGASANYRQSRAFRLRPVPPLLDDTTNLGEGCDTIKEHKTVDSKGAIELLGSTNGDYCQNPS